MGEVSKAPEGGAGPRSPHGGGAGPCHQVPCGSAVAWLWGALWGERARGAQWLHPLASETSPFSCRPPLSLCPSSLRALGRGNPGTRGEEEGAAWARSGSSWAPKFTAGCHSTPPDLPLLTGGWAWNCGGHSKQTVPSVQRGTGGGLTLRPPGCRATIGEFLALQGDSCCNESEGLAPYTQGKRCGTEGHRPGAAAL